MRALTPLSVIASDICSDELGDSTERHHLAVTKWLVRGFQELHLYVTNAVSIKTVVLEADHSVCLPDDFVYQTKVGIRGQNGRIATIWQDYGNTKNNNLLSQSAYDIQSIIDGTLIPNELTTFYNYKGDLCLDGYVYGCGSKGFYQIDEKEGVINLGSSFPEGTEIVIEYKSDGLGDIKLVPTEMVNCLTFYGLYRYYKNKNLTLSQVNYEDYYKQYNRLKRLYNHKPYDYYATLFQNTVRDNV